MNISKENMPTNKMISDILPRILSTLEKTYIQKPNRVLEAWAEIVGEKLSSMTKASSLKEGTLLVLVSNSTLLQLLKVYEKEKLLKILQEKFSKDIIKNIEFRLR